jgi:hypothetical protein
MARPWGESILSFQRPVLKAGGRPGTSASLALTRASPLGAAALRSLRDEYIRTIKPAQRLAAEALTLKHRLGDLVNCAYGLTPDEVALMWATAPPRMPFVSPFA